MGFKPDHVVLLTNRTARKPLNNIKWALGTFLAMAAKRDDLVLIYFAGHGGAEVDIRGLPFETLAVGPRHRRRSPAGHPSLALSFSSLSCWDPAALGRVWRAATESRPS
jgi:hypothetical protein